MPSRICLASYCGGAEAGGFEPPVQFPVRQFSKLVVSATHPHFLQTASNRFSRCKYRMLFLILQTEHSESECFFVLLLLIISRTGIETLSVKISIQLIMNRKKIPLLLLFLVFSTILSFVGYSYYSLFKKPFSGDSDLKLYIYSTTKFDSIQPLLNQNGNSFQRLLFDQLCHYKQLPARLKPGHYIINKGSSVHQVYRLLSGGLQTPVTVTFNNVRTLDQLAKRFSEQMMGDSLTYLRLLTDSTNAAGFGFTLQQFPAMFLPNTYEVYWTVQPQKFFERMSDEYRKFWNQERLAKVDKLGITPIQASIIASIAEEETNDRKEIGTVCGLYYNRIKRGMPLQADPTVKFAMGTFEINRVLLKHLEFDSPYNTYKYPGLPPGPIRIPEGRTIDALLNHTPHNYLYMCAKEDFSGSHNFATTLSEHNRNAARYQNALNAKRIFR